MDKYQLVDNIYNVFDPFEPLLPDDPAYVDCQSVRGDSNIEGDLGKKIIRAKGKPDINTCQLYAGHRGAGKSTELYRLRKYLDEGGCFVVYFSADEEDIDSEDAQYTDILLACTRHLLKDLRANNPDPILHWLRDRWKDLQDLALTTVELDGLSAEAAINTFTKITANIRAVPTERARIRKLIDPHTTTLIKALNEFINQAKSQLPLDKTELVVIADSLDRIVPTIQEDGSTNHELIFIERSQQLKALDCHLVYTVPISLLYSSRANDIYDNYGETLILPMIMVRNQDGSVNQEGLKRLKMLIAQRINKIQSELNLATEVFVKEEILDRLCLMSGGHVRQLMQLIQGAVNGIDTLPITQKAVQRSITKLRDVYRRTVEEEQWHILAEVAKYKELKNDDKYRSLLFNRCILEYQYLDEAEELISWCDVHPLIKDLQRFQTAIANLS